MKKALMVFGGKFHPHEEAVEIFKDELKDEFDVFSTEDLDYLKKEKISNFDMVIVYTTKEKLTEAQEEGIVEYVKNGGKVCGIHSANASFKENKKYLEMLGSKFYRHGPVCEFTVHPVSTHYINKRIESFDIKDEFYLIEIDEKAEILFQGYWQGKYYPLGYTRKYGKGEVFYFAPGHTIETLKNSSFLKVFKRGIRWLNGEREKIEVIRCGIVGYGPSFGMGKYHADFMNSTPDMQTVAFYDINPERVAAAKKDFPEARTYTDFNKFLSDKEIDLVTIITPHNTHKELVVKSLMAGKNTIVEKPMCITLEEADEMIEAAQKNNLMLSVFHNRRWDGDFLTVEKVVQEGRIGKIFNIEAYMGSFSKPREWWRAEKEISGGNFYDWGAHFLYWIILLMPYKIKKILGITQKRVWFNITNEDEVKSVIIFENGEVADIVSSSISAAGKDKMRITGEKGGIRWKWDEIKVFEYRNGQIEETTVPIEERKHHRFYLNIADHLQMGEELEITPEKARKVIGIIDKTGESAEKGSLIEVDL